MTSRFAIASLFAVLATILSAHQAAAVSITYRQGQPVPELGIPSYTGTEDVMLITWAAGLDFGGRADWDVGNINSGSTAIAHSLLRFDITSLAPLLTTNTLISSAKLRLTTSNQSYLPSANGTINVHLLSDANADWTEGPSGGGAPVDGASTWNLRHENAVLASQVAWTGSTGASTAGTDYDPTVLGSAAAITTTNTALEIDLGSDLSFLETWAGGGTNAGFFFKYADESIGHSRINFFSRNTGSGPELIIELAQVPEPSSLLLTGLIPAFLVSRRRRCAKFRLTRTV